MRATAASHDEPVARAAQHLASTVVPGAIVAVAQGDTYTYAVSGAAARHVEPSVVMTAGARTDAGSLTKILATTAALMSLVDAGEVDLDAPVSRYLGSSTAGRSSARELLEHRAGLWEWWPLYLDASSPEEAVAKVKQLPLRHPRNAARHYSDLGFILLGEAVSHVAAAPLADAVNALALDPFGLTHTRYSRPVPGDVVIASSSGDVIERRMIETGTPYPVTGSAQDFARWRTHVLVGEANDGNAFHAFGGCVGHAGLFTTAADVLQFCRGMLDSLAGQGPVSAATARRFVRPGADAAQALGFRIWHDLAGPAVGHTGFPGVAFAFLPERDAAVVMITNRLHDLPAAAQPAPTEPMWQLVRDAAQKQLGGPT